MDVAFLLLPVIGGYYFASRWNCTKYFCAREDGHRLYFRAVLLGTILFFMAYTIRFGLLNFCSWYSDIEKLETGFISPLVENTSKLATKDPSQVGITAVYSLLLGLILSYPLNFLFKKEPWLRKAIKDNEFEMLLSRALHQKRPVALTMENNKVYVGFVIRTIDPTQARKNLSILPLMSGYRNAESKIIFTTYYRKIYEKARRIESGLHHLTSKDFEIVLPVERIHSTNLFDVVAYEAFQKQNVEKTDSKKPAQK